MIEVTDTAAAIARVRAEESALPPEQRLFDDPYARLFVGGAPIKWIIVLAQLLRLPGELHQINLAGHHVLNHTVQALESAFQRTE